MKTLISTLFRSRSANVVYCESCASVCDSACRSNAVRDRARSSATAYSPRF